MNKKLKCCALMLVFTMLVIMLTSNAGASNDGWNEFEYKIGNATVNVSGLKLRTGPGTEFSAIATIGKSQAVKIIGQTGNLFYGFNVPFSLEFQIMYCHNRLNAMIELIALKSLF